MSASHDDWNNLVSELLNLRVEIEEAWNKAQMGRMMSDPRYVPSTKREQRVLSSLSPEVYESVRVQVFAAVECFKQDTELD